MLAIYVGLLGSWGIDVKARHEQAHRLSSYRMVRVEELIEKPLAHRLDEQERFTQGFPSLELVSVNLASSHCGVNAPVLASGT
jgi:hypothetical protein